MVSGVTLSQPARGKDPTKNDAASKPNYIPERQHKEHKGHPKAIKFRRSRRLPTESHRSPNLEVYTTKTGVKADQFKKQKQTRRVSPKMRRQKKKIEREGGILRKSAK